MTAITPSEARTWTKDSGLETLVAELGLAVAGQLDARTHMPIGPHGVGANAAQAFENDVFAIRDYCWCDGAVHDETVPEWDQVGSGWDSMPHSGGTSTGCPVNFEHFTSGIRGTWYKHLGRDVEFSRNARDGEIPRILRECLESLPLPGADDLRAFSGAETLDEVEGPIRAALLRLANYVEHLETSASVDAVHGITEQNAESKLTPGGFGTHEAERRAREILGIPKTGYAVAPGEYLAEWLEHRKVTPLSAAPYLDLVASELVSLIRGAIPIDGPLAERLEKLTGIRQATWLKYEALYRRDLARIER